MSTRKTFAAYIDRDGTICEEGNYISRPEQVLLLPGAAAGLKRIAELGGAIVVVTNQSGIGRGYYSEQDLAGVNERLHQYLEDEGVAWDALYYCPHYYGGEVAEYDVKCDCRKPASGMVERARKEFGLEGVKEFVIGDRDTDIGLGHNIGASTILVTTGYGAETAKRAAAGEFEVDFVADGLPAAAEWIGKQL